MLQAILSGAYRDEWDYLSSPPSYALPALSAAESGNIANTLLGITTGTQAWRGPLANVADLVGHFVSNANITVSGSDAYQYTPPAPPSGVVKYTYAGFSSALSGNTLLSGSAIWDPAYSASSQYIQRFRESAIRPLVDCGQTRVWNLLIDVVAQTGRYPTTATGLDQFVVNGQTHLWVHVAIDRYTGQVVDRELEPVYE